MLATSVTPRPVSTLSDLHCGLAANLRRQDAEVHVRAVRNGKTNMGGHHSRGRRCLLAWTLRVVACTGRCCCGDALEHDVLLCSCWYPISYLLRCLLGMIDRDSLSPATLYCKSLEPSKSVMRVPTLTCKRPSSALDLTNFAPGPGRFCILSWPQTVQAIAAASALCTCQTPQQPKLHGTAWMDV